MLCDSTARWAGVLFVSWAGIHYKREIIDDWMCPPTMFWTHWRNRNCAKTSRLKMLISVFHLTREIVPTTEHRWNCLTKTWLAKFRNSSSKNSNLHVIYAPDIFGTTHHSWFCSTYCLPPWLWIQMEISRRFIDIKRGHSTIALHPLIDFMALF